MGEKIHCVAKEHKHCKHDVLAAYKECVLLTNPIMGEVGRVKAMIQKGVQVPVSRTAFPGN
jgi:hypothetical protein